MSTPLFSWPELTQITGGRWILPPVTDQPGVDAVVMDSREVGPGQLFLAFKGEKHDSHVYLGDVAQRGAAAAIIDRPLDEPDLAPLRDAGVACLLVANTLKAYQQLGAFHRQRFPQLLVVAVTGSSGKTSTKEILRAILSAKWPGKVLATAGNTNNLIGVPRNLLNLTADHRAAVIELGTNAPGEIPTLADIVRPDIAVLTSVGPVHLEGLGSIEGVAREKAAIFGPLDSERGHAVLPAKLAANPIIAERLPTRTVTVGAEPGADLRASFLGGTFDHSRFRFEQAGEPPIDTRSNLLGAHQAANAGLGVAVGRLAGVSTEGIAAALEQIVLPDMRMAVTERDGIRWVNDAYNANHDSMCALVDWLAALDPGTITGRLVFCLGDMLELGPTGPELHRAVLDHVRALFPDAVILPVGSIMSSIAPDLGLTAYPDPAAARPVLYGDLRKNDTVVVKGSRGIHMEALL